MNKTKSHKSKPTAHTTRTTSSSNGNKLFHVREATVKPVERQAKQTKAKPIAKPTKSTKVKQATKLAKQGKGPKAARRTMRRNARKTLKTWAGKGRQALGFVGKNTLKAINIMAFPLKLVTIVPLVAILGAVVFVDKNPKYNPLLRINEA